MLHPAGPDDEEDIDEEEDEEEEAEEESSDEEAEGAVDMEEYKHAVLELEGLKVSETHRDTQDQEELSERTEEEKQTETVSAGKCDEEKEGEEVLKEAEDECPELTDLSALNKEFKPFRYVFTLDKIKPL